MPFTTSSISIAISTQPGVGTPLISAMAFAHYNTKRVAKNTNDSDPQSGANTVMSTGDIVTLVMDRAAKADIGGSIRSKAGRPQPPTASGFATCSFIIIACRLIIIDY